MPEREGSCQSKARNEALSGIREHAKSYWCPRTADIFLERNYARNVERDVNKSNEMPLRNRPAKPKIRHFARVAVALEESSKSSRAR
jgi:hypothetical protein